MTMPQVPKYAEVERWRANVSKPIITNTSIQSPCCGAGGIMGKTGTMSLDGSFRVEYICAACGRPFTADTPLVGHP